MPDSTTQHRTGAEEGSEVDDPGPDPGRRGPSRNRGLVPLLAGATGVVAAVPPGLGIVALALAALAVGTGVPVMRKGPGTAGFPLARTGVVLGVIAVLLGLISLAMQVI